MIATVSGLIIGRLRMELRMLFLISNMAYGMASVITRKHESGFFCVAET